MAGLSIIPTAIGTALGVTGLITGESEARRRERALAETLQQRRAALESTIGGFVPALKQEALGIEPAAMSASRRAREFQQRRSLGVDIENRRQELLNQLTRLGGLSNRTTLRFLSPAAQEALSRFGIGSTAAEAGLRARQNQQALAEINRSRRAAIAGLLQVGQERASLAGVPQPQSGGIPEALTGLAGTILGGQIGRL